MTDPSTSADCIRAAWTALTKGNKAERDRLLDRAKLLLAAEENSSAVQRVLAVDFYVTARGVAYPSINMARAAGLIH
jgi:hypothetical protein